MQYTLTKKTTVHSRGCPEDESETSTTETEFFLVSEKDQDDFGEKIADEMGYQDYNLKIDYKDIAKFSEDDLEKIRLLLKPKVKIEVFGGVAECTSCPDDVDVEIIDHDFKDVTQKEIESQGDVVG